MESIFLFHWNNGWCNDAKRKIQLKDNFKKIILPTISQSYKQLKKKKENDQEKKEKTIKHSSTSYYFKNSVFNKLLNILKQK